MGGFAAFGTGFFNKLNANREAAEDEERVFRRQMFQNWNQTVLPKVIEQRRKDDESLARMNQYAQDPRLQGQPEKAFWAAKAVSLGEYKNLDEVMLAYEKDPTIAPEAVLKAQRAALDKTFTYDVDPNSGSLANFKFKPQATPAMPEVAPGGQKPSFWSKLGGQGDLAGASGQARSDFVASTGIDPVAGVQSRFDTAPSSGTLSLKPIDQRAEALKKEGRNFLASNPQYLTDTQSYYAALAAGDNAALEKMASNPNFVRSRQAVESSEDMRAFNRNFRNSLATDIISNPENYKDTSGLLQAVVSGRDVGEVLAKNIKSPEEKLAFKAKIKSVEQAYGSINDPEGFKRARALGLFDTLNIPKAQLDAAEKMADKEIKDKKSVMDQILREQVNARAKPGEEIAPVGPASMPTEEAPAQQAPQEESPVLPDAVRVTPEKSNIKEVRVSADEKPNLRVGDDPGLAMTDGETVKKAVDAGDENTLAMANPFTVLDSINRYKPKDKANAEKTIKALRFNVDDINKLKTDEQFGRKFDEQVAPYDKYIPKVNSMEEANKLPAGSLVNVKTAIGWQTVFSKGTGQ